MRQLYPTSGGFDPPNWRQYITTMEQHLLVPGENFQLGVLTHLPRPPRLPLPPSEFSPIPKRDREVFKISPFRVVWRLLGWGYPIAYYCLHFLWDWLRGRDSLERRGMWLRLALEKTGGLFIKLGQQLSTRLDILPAEICYELSKLLEDIAPFPTEQAIEAIKRVTEKPLEETFLAFDPEPLGSASVACVYHAVLKTGENVVVKVRRPNIGYMFAADLAALDLLCMVLEGLTLIRPGITHVLRKELRAMFMEELDFRQEARYQELFRRQAKRDKQKYLSAPRVFHKLSGKDVLVSEYVTGVWLLDLLAAKESKNKQALVYYKAMNISPKKIARRLIRTRHWATLENLFYHADPHPGNIVVQPNNKLVFIDFGACGPTTHTTRRDNIELFQRQADKDVAGMVQVMLNILGPHPHLDLHDFTKAGEAQTWLWMYALESKHSEWWERTTAGMWIRLFEATREFGISINMDAIRTMRSTLLYDTVAARLYKRISMEREFQKYAREAQTRAIKRMGKYVERNFNPGRIAVEIERLMYLGRRLLYRLEQVANEPTASFLATVNKGAYVGSEFLQYMMLTMVITSVATGYVVGKNYIAHTSQSVLETLTTIVSIPLYWVVLGLLALRTYRKIQYRLHDKDSQSRS